MAMIHHSTFALEFGSSESLPDAGGFFDLEDKQATIRVEVATVAVRRQIGIETNSFFTIGHSTRTIVEFAELLQESRVDFVVDVRSMPRSRTNPQFNEDSLPTTLTPRRIGYEHIAALGGLRGKARGPVPSPNSYWRVNSFRNYADYALTEPFAKGLAQLRELGSEHRCAIMCAEAVWWRCHRRIIADYLLGEGERVMHILGAGHVEEASLTPGAVVREDGTIVYPGEHFLGK